MNFSNLKEWKTPRGKVKELAIDGKIVWTSHRHSYTAKTTAPTCTAQGYTTYTCSCGDSYKDNYKAATGHKYGTAYLSSEFSTGYGQKCSVCGALKALSNPYVSGLAVGSSIFMKVNGVKTEFLVVHQGLPSSDYDSSCDGTWLLMKNIYSNRIFANSGSSFYPNSDIHAYLRDSFINLFDAGIKSVIKELRIPYITDKSSDFKLMTGSSGMYAKVFLLSYTEVGLSGSSYANSEGAVLSYFNGATDSKRVANLNGSASIWFLRSPYTKNGINTWMVNSDGSDGYKGSMYSYGLRPALILPSTTVIDGTLISKT